MFSFYCIHVGGEPRVFVEDTGRCKKLHTYTYFHCAIVVVFWVAIVYFLFLSNLYTLAWYN